MAAYVQLVEAADWLLSGCEVIRGATPEHDDIHTHEKHPEDALRAALAAVKAASLPPALTPEQQMAAVRESLRLHDVIYGRPERAK